MLYEEAKKARGATGSAGKTLQNPPVPFPQGPEGTGREMGEGARRNAQDDA